MRGRGRRTPSVLFRIAAPPGEAERLVAELASLGTSGVEERDDALLAYFPADGAPLAELRALADLERGVEVHGAAIEDGALQEGSRRPIAADTGAVARDVRISPHHIEHGMLPAHHLFE